MSKGTEYAIVGMVGLLAPFAAVCWVNALYGFCLWLGWSEALAGPVSVMSLMAVALGVFASVMMIYEKNLP